MDLLCHAHARRIAICNSLLFCASLMLGSLSGCSRESLPPNDPNFAAQFAELKRLRETSNIKLLRELRRIDQAEGLPLQRMSEARSFRYWLQQASAGKSIQDQKNAARALASIYTRGKVKRLLRDGAELFPKRFPPWPEELRKLSERRVDNDDARARFAKLIRLPQCDFGVEFERGLLADMTFVDFVRVGADQESYYAIEMLLRGKTDQSLESVQSVMLAARRLMETGHPTSRLAAVDLNKRAMTLIQWSVQQPGFNDQQVRACLNMVHAQLDAWPEEEQIWISDRSDGLHAFEMIREGYLLSVLSKKELDRIDQEIGLDAFQKAVAANLDSDQLFYLQHAQRMIDACRRPYVERIPLFEDLAIEFARLRSTEKHPLISDWILMSHWQLGHRACALDLARMQGLSLALSQTLGEPARKYEINPLTGLAFRTENDAETIRVFGVGPPADDEPIVFRRREVRVGRRVP